MWAYLAIFAGDLEPAQHLLERAWEHRALAADERLSATIAQRRAFLATCRLRSGESIEWAERAVALAPHDTANGLFAAASLAHGLSHAGRRADAHAALDRWLDDPGAPPPGSGFVLLALKANLLIADGDLAAARRGVRDLGARQPRRGPARGRRDVALRASPASTFWKARGTTP